jgi:hypothetical protein
MSVGEVAIDSVVKPLGDAADGKRRRNEVRPCFRTDLSERFGSDIRDYKQIGAIKG